MYVDDLVEITKWFIRNKPQFNVYNVCTGKVYDLKSLAKKVLEIANKDLPILINREGFGNEYSGTNNRLIETIDNYSFCKINYGIKNLMKYYNRILSEI